VEALAAHGRHIGHTRARGWGSVQAQVAGPSETHPDKEGVRMLRKIVYSLGALAVLAMAVGAGFRPW